MLTPISPASANSRASSPGWSGTATKTVVSARTGPPCLPGIAAVPATPRSRTSGDRGPVAVGSSAAAAVSRSSRTSRSSAVSAVGVGGDDLLPQPRVAGGDPGDVADALPRQREVLARGVGEPAGDQRGQQVRQVGGAGDRLVVLHRG